MVVTVLGLVLVSIVIAVLGVVGNRLARSSQAGRDLKVFFAVFGSTLGLAVAVLGVVRSGSGS